MDELNRLLDQELSKNEKMLHAVKTALQNAPKGSLRCDASKKTNQYYHYDNTGETVVDTYIKKKERAFAVQLAQHDYYKMIAPVLEHRLRTIRQFQNELGPELSEMYDGLHPARKALVTPLIESNEDFVKNWELISFSKKPFDKDDDTSFYTAKGERVRSKSEVLIADELYRQGVPYRYEYPLTLYVHGRPKIFRPDFMVLNVRTRKEYYLEHFGLMSNESYFDSAMRKLDVFEQNNILIGRDLLILHESSGAPLNLNTLKLYIEEYLI